MSIWIKIQNFQCPGKNCSNKSSGDWVCGKDNTDMYMSQTGYIRCNAASRHYCSNDLNSWHHIDKISNWRWDCGMHGSHPFQKYIEADKTAFILSMSMALQMVKNKGRARWIAALVLELGKQYGDDDSDDDVK
ncbi:elongation factor 2 kinase [Mytilus galloprovincialis]|uniref:Elongation factor 2 kinase n=1 Tax=Mytilus galloprovincialis TaxID=29158 RepID=A0A8B6D6Q4_MYTGA|nr:elongation factor 2 kinase [Mytilus galloprovincialis]